MHQSEYLFKATSKNVRGGKQKGEKIQLGHGAQYQYKSISSE